MSNKSQKIQGKEFTTTLQAGTEQELDTMISGLHDYAHAAGLEDFDVVQKRQDPDGGYEAIVRAHNWNGFRWLKEKVGKLKEDIQERSEEHREKTLSELREKTAKHREELAKTKRELAERKAKREAKERKKREVPEARAEAVRLKAETVEARLALRREKHAGLVRAVEAITGLGLKKKKPKPRVRAKAKKRRVRTGKRTLKTPIVTVEMVPAELGKQKEPSFLKQKIPKEVRRAIGM